jgi:hypothetical protein
VGLGSATQCTRTVQAHRCCGLAGAASRTCALHMARQETTSMHMVRLLMLFALFCCTRRNRL